MQRESKRRGAAVIPYEGKRGVVWRIKYQDASGRQVMETVGAERDGWTREKARAILEERLVDVRRQGLRQASKETVASFAREWIETYPLTKGLKFSTREGYQSIIDNHLIPAFGHLRLGNLDSGDVQRYVADALAAGLAPQSVLNHLNVLHAIFKTARKRKLVTVNPVEDVDRPKVPRRRWTILTPAEVSRVERAFTELAAEVAGDDDDAQEEHAFREQARVVFLVVNVLGLRRGELLGLRWRRVFLADPEGACLRVEETLVRYRPDSPKSEASERTIPLGSRLAEELFLHRGRTRFSGDDEYVFCNPFTGSALDRKRYAELLRLALAKAKITKPVRPFHDGRHTALTNSAAAGNAPAAIQAQAGHADFSTTQLYIDLAGVTFREEAQAAEDRLLGGAPKRDDGGER